MCLVTKNLRNHRVLLVRSQISEENPLWPLSYPRIFLTAFETLFFIPIGTRSSLLPPKMLLFTAVRDHFRKPQLVKKQRTADFAVPSLG